jgi:hypothetical protein
MVGDAEKHAVVVADRENFRQVYFNPARLLW